MKKSFPQKCYHYNRKLISFNQNKDEVLIHLENDDHKNCDLLIGADGINSTVRRQLLPQTLPSYAEYIVWSGSIDEKNLSLKEKNVFVDKISWFKGENTHILCYFIPGLEGETSIGKRRLNWIWYVNMQNNRKFKRLLPYINRTIQTFSVSMDIVNDDIVEELQAVAKELLPIIFYNVICDTKNPFIYIGYDLSVSKMIFGKVYLIGDAAFVARHQIAAGISKAAKNAITLSEALEQYRYKSSFALKKWENSQISIGRYLISLGSI